MVLTCQQQNYSFCCHDLKDRDKEEDVRERDVEKGTVLTSYYSQRTGHHSQYSNLKLYMQTPTHLQQAQIFSPPSLRLLMKSGSS